MTKCWAYCDRERDLDDILAINPSAKEIETIRKWLLPLDANLHWPEHVNGRMDYLMKKIKDLKEK